MTFNYNYKKSLTLLKHELFDSSPSVIWQKPFASDVGCVPTGHICSHRIHFQFQMKHITTIITVKAFMRIS